MIVHPRRRRIGVWFSLAFAGVAPAAAAVATAFDAAPGRPDAGIVLEPAVLALGATAVADLVVSTPPDYALRLLDALPELPGVWTLDSRLLPVERGTDRWIHRLRMRVRAREVGAFDWPAFRVAVERSDGTRETIDVPGRRIEVASSLALRAPTAGPFGLRAPALPGSSTDPLLHALFGALMTCALLGLVALVRRERRKRGAPPPAATRPGAPPPAQPAARALLQIAQEQAAADPVAAAALVTQAARRLLAGITHEAPAARTTEELASGLVPYAVRSRWQRWLALLAELDRLRFTLAPEDAGARVRVALREAQGLIDDTETTRAREDANDGADDASERETARVPHDPGTS